eukprot:Opistho-2@15208
MFLLSSWLSSRPCSSATWCIRLSTWSSGTVSVVEAPIEFSMYCDATSRSSNCFSNLSIMFDICSIFIDCAARSMACTTPAIDFVTCFIRTAVSTRDATASILELMRRKLSAWLCCRIEFSAWMRAPSWFPFCIACLSFTFSAFSSFSHFCAVRFNCFAANLRLKRWVSKLPPPNHDENILAGCVSLVKKCVVSGNSMDR